MIAIISVIYEETKPETYQGIKLRVHGKSCVFAVGSPEDDYGCAAMLANRYGLLVLHSSSVDHFVMDGGDLGVFN